MILVLECIIGCLIFGTFIKASVLKNKDMWIQEYPESVQRRYIELHPNIKIYEKHDNGVASLVSLACTYESQIYLVDDTKRINAKSIMGLMAFPFEKGKEIIVSAQGNDTEAAVEKVAEFLS